MKQKFNCPLFGDDIYLIVGDKTQAEKFCDKLEISPNHNGRTVEIKDKINGVQSLLVWVDKKDNFYTLVHECLHLVVLSFKHHGLPFNPKNQEMIAYYQNYWVRKFWHAMSKKKEKKK